MPILTSEIPIALSFLTSIVIWWNFFLPFFPVQTKIYVLLPSWHSKLCSWWQEECSLTRPCHHGFPWVFNKGRVRSHHHQRKLHGRPLQCNPAKLPFPKITQNTECCLMNVTVEQVNCKLLNKSAFKRICRNGFNL